MNPYDSAVVFGLSLLLVSLPTLLMVIVVSLMDPGVRSGRPRPTRRHFGPHGKRGKA